jgi:pyrimidine-nucleoside phosphorylase
MNQPLGNAIGNALEVREAVDTLHGGGPVDIKEHCLEVAGNMLVLAGREQDLNKAIRLALTAINDGTAFGKFKELVEAQGGDVSYVENPEHLPCAPLIETVSAPQSGFLAGVNAKEVGLTAGELGAGRAVKGEPIDHAVGVVVHHKVGDRLEAGDPLFTIHARTRDQLENGIQRLLQAHTFSEEPIEPLPLFYRKVGP